MPGRAVEYQGHGPHLYRQCGREGRYSHPGPAQPRPRDPSPVPGLRSHLKALALEERRDFRSHKPRQARPGPKGIYPSTCPQCLPTSIFSSHSLHSTQKSNTDVAAVASQTSWRPQLHSVWDRILSLYLDPAPQPAVATPKAKKGAKPKPARVLSSRAPFQDFWRVIVDESLFDNSASHERKYWGFQIVERVLPLLPSDQTPFIFTANFMRCFINNLSSEDRFLNKAARHT
ncbi:hypothetical protein BC936DRAFT_138400, partial [Jimgerdemannia flammicorona]